MRCINHFLVTVYCITCNTVYTYKHSEYKIINMCVPLEMCATPQRSTGMPGSGLPEDKLQKLGQLKVTMQRVLAHQPQMPHTSYYCYMMDVVYNTRRPVPHTHAHMCRQMLWEVGGLGQASLSSIVHNMTWWGNL